MVKIYYDHDADLNMLKDKTVGIIGYGIQGRGQSLCLRESGVKVIISELEGTQNYQQAINDGFQVFTAEEVAKQADIIQILTQDHVQAEVYKKSIKKHLKPAKALCFSHGFNIHFKQIKPPKDIDVFMVAPKGPGALVWEMYKEGKGVPALVAVYQDVTGNALKLALAYAKAIGATRAGVIETIFKEETETDLFGEQVVLCGGVSALIQTAFDVLVEAGYQPEIAYFEVLHELKLITDLVYQYGISGMRRRVSNTACYGDLTRGPRVINEKVKKVMKKILKEIQTGKFAREWIKENKTGRQKFNELLAKGDQHPIEEVGRRIRDMIPWIKK
jgi:ketol-acid reductoisomerase